MGAQAHRATKSMREEDVEQRGFVAFEHNRGGRTGDLRREENLRATVGSKPGRRFQSDAAQNPYGERIYSSIQRQFSPKCAKRPYGKEWNRAYTGSVNAAMSGSPSNPMTM